MTPGASAAVGAASEGDALGGASAAREPRGAAPGPTPGSAPVAAPVRPRRADGKPPPAQRAGVTTYSTRRRSPARAVVLIGGAAVIAAVALVLVLSSRGSSSGRSSTAASTATAAHARAHRTHASTTTRASTTHAGESSTPVVSPAEAQVAVLNATSTPNLAHRLSSTLQQSGYSQATPLNGTPPGSHQTTVVEYTPGHRAEAARVAQALGVARVQPIEAGVSSLVGSSTVVVIAGLDRAGAAGEASSSGGGGGGGGGSVP